MGDGNRAPCVLVVDDDQHLVVAISEVLQEAGYETRVAVDGHGAIQRLSLGYATYVSVLDLMMPIVNGFEVVNWLRQRDLRIPIVLATQEDDVRATDLVGSVVKLSKPFTAEQLLEAVADARKAGRTDKREGQI